MELARTTGRTLARHGIQLVYGGARVGTMGAIADAALEAGGQVVGVIPRGMIEREIAHRGLTDLRIVDSMAERKALMTELSDAFLTLPGGYGTLDEIFEVLTGAILQEHEKPIALLNAEGFYDGLLTFLDTAVRAGFLRPPHHELLLVERELPPLLERLGIPVESASAQT